MDLFGREESIGLTFMIVDVISIRGRPHITYSCDGTKTLLCGNFAARVFRSLPHSTIFVTSHDYVICGRPISFSDPFFLFFFRLGISLLTLDPQLDPPSGRFCGPRALSTASPELRVSSECTRTKSRSPLVLMAGKHEFLLSRTTFEGD